MGTSSTPSTTTQKTEPPAYQLPYLQQGLGYTQGLFNEGGPQQYDGNTVVPFSPQTEQALSGIEQRATNGSPVVQSAQNFVQQGLNTPASSSFGNNANPYAGQAYTSPSGNPYASSANPFGGASNPYLDQTFQHAADQSYNALSGQFARSGRNINAAAPAQADMLTNLASQIYAPAYENERNRQLQYQSQLTGIGAQGFESAQGREFQSALQGQQIGAQGYENSQNRMLQDLQAQRSNQQGLLGYATPLAQNDYQDLAALQGVGSQVEGLTGRIIDDNASRWDYEQNRPEDALNQYLQRISGNLGQTTTINAPQSRNRTAGAVGGALSGAQLGSMFGPWGTAIGAVGGGLFGGFA